MCRFNSGASEIRDPRVIWLTTSANRRFAGRDSRPACAQYEKFFGLFRENGRLASRRFNPSWTVFCRTGGGCDARLARIFAELQSKIDNGRPESVWPKLLNHSLHQILAVQADDAGRFRAADAILI